MTEMAGLDDRAAIAVGDLQALFRLMERFRREDQRFPAVRAAILAYVALNEGATEPEIAERFGLGLETLASELAALGPSRLSGRGGHSFLRADAIEGGHRRFWLTPRGRSFVQTLTAG